MPESQSEGIKKQFHEGDAGGRLGEVSSYSGRVDANHSQTDSTDRASGLVCRAYLRFLECLVSQSDLVYST